MKARTIVGAVCCLAVLAVALDAATGTLTSVYTSAWTASGTNPGTVTYKQTLGGTAGISGSNRSTDPGTYQWEDLGNQRTRVWGSYTVTVLGQSKFSGNYSVVLTGPGGGTRPISTAAGDSTAAITSGINTYAAITDNGQPGTAVGSFSASNTPTQLDISFPSVTY